MSDLIENVKRYCDTCLAKKYKKNFSCNVQNAIDGIAKRECYSVILHIPERKDEIVANCSCFDEARIYGDYLSNAIWVGVK